jgi:hypothetical protein
MAHIIMASGQTAWLMVREGLFTLTEIVMKETGKMIGLMDMEFIFTQMEQNTKESG